MISFSFRQLSSLYPQVTFVKCIFVVHLCFFGIFLRRITSFWYFNKAEAICNNSPFAYDDALIRKTASNTFVTGN